MKFLKVLSIIILSINSINLLSQTNSPKINAYSKKWPEVCKKIVIPSTLDGNIQPAYFYKASGNRARPLIVSLHSWSGGYDQKDTLSWMSIANNYHYIHPHFRGPNNTPQACGSPYAIQDIEDAIDYALQNANVDTTQIHIMGTSGGGYATLLAYMKTQHPIKTFSAWVPISDIQRWYHESVQRKNKYALHIAKATTGNPDFSRDYHYIDDDEAIKRSPIFMKTPTEKRQNSQLFIYAGIHDGFKGSVPITQSLLFYNKVVREYDPSAINAIIPESHIQEMITTRNFQQKEKKKIGNRILHYQKSYKNLVQVSIFEGGHEMLPEIALKYLPK